LKSAPKPSHITLANLLLELKQGHYVIPDFQREFEWDPWDVRDLVRSIFMDYYIGSLLLWKGKKENYEALSCQKIYGFSGIEDPEQIVLDGQQRLTAMHYAFVGSKEKFPGRSSRAYFSVRVDRFMNEEYDKAFEYDWESRSLNKLLSDTNALYDEHLFPCSVIGSAGFELWNWLQGYEKYWTDQASAAAERGDTIGAEQSHQHAVNAHEFGEHVASLAHQYQISYIELDQDLDIDRVCDIFTQLNSKGVRLDVFDLMNALLRPKELKLKEMWHQAAPRFEFVDTGKMNVYVLQVMSILRQAYCSPKYLYFLLPGQEKPVRDPDGTRRREVLIPNSAAFAQLWYRAVKALDDAIKLLRHPQEFGAVSSRYLPYVSILPVFAALQAHVASSPAEARFSGQRKIRHWYWASVFTKRYSGSVESTSARDYMDVRAWIADDAAEPPLIQEFASAFRNLDLRNETKSGTSVYNGIFNLLILGGARDWITGNIPPFDDLDDHHIVPASWGKKHLEGTLVHSILNRTPLTADTNRKVINDRLPNVYLPTMIEQNGEADVRATLGTHFISPTAFDILRRDPFTAEDFESFIAERQRTIQDAIENLLIKERIDLPPKLRELDEGVECVELLLRRLIDDALAGDASRLPPHVLQKMTDRIQSAERKNAVFDTQRYATLAGRLEYSDLRELQETIVGKPTWPLFEPRFANKDMLIIRFNQLAELRNGIRHSRAIDEITRKEGEAAILWFTQVLGKATPVSMSTIS
jgi:hypothetical protein